MPINIYLAYDEIDNVKELFNEYLKWFFVNINVEKELANLPGKYALPKGRLYLARCDGNLAGCVAIKPVEDNKCEIKRLYVRPEYRGEKIGSLLIEEIIKDAKHIGYHSVRLGTLTTLREAVALYEKKGFYATEPYSKKSSKDAIYMALDLRNKNQDQVV